LLINSGIYIITHTSCTNGGYVGACSQSFRKRWRIHLTNLNLDKHHCEKLQTLVNNTGLEQIKFKILEIVSDKALLDEQERFWVTKLHAIEEGFNSQSGGRKEFKVGNLVREKLKKRSYKKGKFGALNNLSKPVYQYDLEGHFIQEFAGHREASRMTGIDRSAIGHAVRGKELQQFKGFQWFSEFKGEKIASVVKWKKQHKEVIQLHLTNLKIREFNSVTEAAKAVGTGTTNISKACKTGSICKGFKWKYK
jgi:group I intron endonuclease